MLAGFGYSIVWICARFSNADKVNFVRPRNGPVRLYPLIALVD